LVGLKVAWVDGEWVVTSKRINLADVKVAARSSDFVKGDTKALLKAVPGIVRQLFEGEPTTATESAVLGMLSGTELQSSAATSATSPPRIEEKPAVAKNETFAWILIGSGAALLVGSLGFDLFAPSSKDHDLGPVDFVPLAGYGGGATLLVWGIREL
jgi:hypothetical protein